MALNLYLDDCANSDLLARLLRHAGHYVVRPNDKDVDLEGSDDETHLKYAAARQLTILTKNPADFLKLHQGNQEHAGILAVYQDNDRLRDMSQAEIVKAIANLEAVSASGGNPIAGSFHILNEWRY